MLTMLVHFAPWYRNQMVVEVEQELKEKLDTSKTGLEVAADYVEEGEVLEGYLKRGFGNAYDFNQVAKVEGF